MTERPDLARLLGDPTSLPQDQIPAAIGEIEELKATLWARLLSPTAAPKAVDPEFDQSLLPVSDVAQRMGVPRQYVYELAKRGDLPAIRFGKYVRVRACDLQRWLARHRD